MPPRKIRHPQFLKGVHRVRKRLAAGARVEYHYAWRGGPLFWKSGTGIEFGSAEYFAAFAQAGRAPASNPKGKLFRDIIVAFLNSNDFKRLAPRTQRDYQIWKSRIDEKFGDAPAAAFNKPAIRHVALAWRDQWSGRQAQYAWQVLTRIVSWAYEAGLLQEHHLRGSRNVYRSDRAEIIWTAAEIEAFCAAMPDYIGRALVAATETGLRPGDLIRLSRAHIETTPRGRRILIRTEKKKRMASIPVTAKMGEVLDSMPSDQFLVLTRGYERGAWTVRTLSNATARGIKKAGIREELRLYDARGTAATRLLMEGATLSEIAVIMGWSVKTAAAMIEVYAVLDPSISDGVLVRLERAKAGTKM